MRVYSLLNEQIDIMIPVNIICILLSNPDVKQAFSTPKMFWLWTGLLFYRSFNVIKSTLFHLLSFQS